MSNSRGVIVRRTGGARRVRQLGPYQIEGFLDKDEEIGQTVWRVRIEADATTATSYHLKAEEIYFVLHGSGVAVLDGVRHVIATGDFMRLPAGTRHGFEAGPEGLEMLDVHAPGCWPDRDTFFEGTAPEGFGE